jgi:hypothetical protein
MNGYVCLIGIVILFSGITEIKTHLHFLTTLNVYESK